MAEDRDIARERIMEAARKRFYHYGYAKTTMAEVATDCSMSPGNLYRFFPGKLDIAEGIAQQAERVRQHQLDLLAAAAGRSAREKLYDFFFSELRSTYAQLAEDPQAVEIANIIAQSRPAFAEQRVATERRLIRQIIEEGNRAGEFYVADPEYAAASVHSATMKFRFPQRWTKAPLETLERELGGVLHLLIDGLSQHSPSIAAA